MNLEETSKF